MEISGFYYDGDSSERHPARAQYLGHGTIRFLKEQADDSSEHSEILSEYAVQEVSFSSRIGNTPRFLHFGHQCQFESSDNDKIDQLIQTATQGGYLQNASLAGMAHRLESRLLYIALTLCLVVASSWAFVKFGIPAFGKEIADALPAEVSTKIGLGGLEILDQSVFEASELSDSRKAELERSFERIIEQLGLDQREDIIPMQIEFRKSPIVGPNAFALPSGTVVFTDEMIELADNTSQLETIMLHEIGHIVYRHSLRQVIQQSSLALLVVVVTGDISTTSQLILALPSILMQAGYSQDMEREADGFVLKHMNQLDLQADDFITLMEKIEALPSESDSETDLETGLEKEKQEEHSIQDYFSSHPSTAERLERFRLHHQH